LTSAYFATKDIRDTSLNLQGMFKLKFLPSNQAIIALIVAGGIALVSAQYWIARKAAQWAYSIGRKS